MRNPTEPQDCLWQLICKADDTPDFCCGTFVAQQSCATKVARVSYLVAESCNKLRNKNPNRNQLHFSATCCSNAERWLVNSCLRLVVYVTRSSALCVNSVIYDYICRPVPNKWLNLWLKLTVCVLFKLLLLVTAFWLFKIIRCLIALLVDIQRTQLKVHEFVK